MHHLKAAMRLHRWGRGRRVPFTDPATLAFGRTREANPNMIDT